MSDVADALAVLQFGDSFFPSGAVSFSWGLEGLSDSGVVTDAMFESSESPAELNATTR